MGTVVSLEIQIALAGLPEPLLDSFCHNPGRKWRWDLSWADHPSRLLVDIQGGVWCRGKHVRGAGIANDLEKQNDATLAGFKVLVFTTDHVHSGYALKMIQRALEAKA